MIEFIVGLLLGNILKTCPNQKQTQYKPMTEKELKEAFPLIAITILMAFCLIGIIYLTGWGTL